MWCFGKTYDEPVRIDGKVVILTGGNAGIGKETAKELYKRGGRVLILCRDQEKTQAAIADIEHECAGLEGSGELVAKPLDLGSLASVRACAEDILRTEPQIHLLINNAGVLFSPARRTVDGFETHFGVNHLGHFLLTLLLVPTIIKSAPARIVNVSSMGHRLPFVDSRIHFDDINFEKRKYNHLFAYMQSKLANILFTKELARRLKEAGIDHVTTYTLHPGVAASDMDRNLHLSIPGYSRLWRHLKSWALMTTAQGARTTLYCALNEKLANESGLYYSNCAQATPSLHARDMEAAKKLWERSVQYTRLEDFDPFDIKELNYKL